MATKPTATKMPKTLGETIDLLYTIRAERLALDKTVAEMKAQETAIRQHIMANFDKARLDGAKGKIAVAAIKHNTVADVDDWDLFFPYISRTKSWDLLQKRVSIIALKARWDAGQIIPGVSSHVEEELSLTKVGAK